MYNASVKNFRWRRFKTSGSRATYPLIVSALPNFVFQLQPIGVGVKKFPSILFLSSCPLFRLLCILFQPLVGVGNFDLSVLLAGIDVYMVRPSGSWISVGCPGESTSHGGRAYR